MIDVMVRGLARGSSVPGSSKRPDRKHHFRGQVIRTVGFPCFTTVVLWKGHADCQAASGSEPISCALQLTFVFRSSDVNGSIISLCIER